MKYQKIFVSVVVLVSVFMIVISFKMKQYTVEIGEQATQVTSDLLQTILHYTTIANILCAFAIVLLCLLLSAFCYQKYKKLCKKE